jgi:hypothetical protein
MHELTGHFKTPNGSKYLQQLCKHFAHKIDVEYTPTQANCAFPLGQAVMTADKTGLTVRFELENTDAEPQARNVIDSHLKTFAFRENFVAMDWS